MIRYSDCIFCDDVPENLGCPVCDMREIIDKIHDQIPESRGAAEATTKIFTMAMKQAFANEANIDVGFVDLNEVSKH